MMIEYYNLFIAFIIMFIVIFNVYDFTVKHGKRDVLVPEQRPYYILKYPISVKQWKTVMPYYNHSTMSWDEMNTFIEKMSLKLGVKLRLPTSVEWQYARDQIPMLESYVHEAEIRFWIYNRPYGSLIDPNVPTMRKYELCAGAMDLPPEIFLSCGNGHDSIALFLITFDDCNSIKENDAINGPDFCYVY